MPGNNTIKTTLMKSAYFDRISAQTKTDILNSIEFELDETGFSRDDLAMGLRYLLAQNSQKYQAYIQPQSKTATYTPDLYFGVPNNTDWMLLYLLTRPTSVPYHHLHHYGSGHSSRDTFKNCDGRAILMAALIALACVCCCIGSYANYRTTQSNETQNLKTGKIIVSLILFLAAAIPAGIFTDPELLLAPEPVTNDENAAIRFTSAFFAGAAAYCVSAGLFAMIPCVPRTPTVRPPSAELLAVLDPVKRLLDGDWVREGDDPQQVIAFVKTVIRLHIENLSKPEVESTHERTPLYKSTTVNEKSSFDFDHYLQPIPSAPEIDDLDRYSVSHV